MKIKFQDIICQSLAYKQLNNDYLTNNLSHAYVFTSPDYLGLDVLCQAFLSQIIGGDNQLLAERVQDSSLLDIIRLPLSAANTTATSKKMLVSDADYIADTCYMTPVELDYKYYIIAPDEPMSELVQNKLLKTLEEPPKCARFIIFSKGESELLPTIISRSRVVRLQEFTSISIEEELKKYYADDFAISLAAASCRGQLGLAQEMVTSEKYARMYEVAYEVLIHMKRSTQILPQAATLAMLKESLPIVLDYFELILCDIMVYNSGRPDLLTMKNNFYDIKGLASDFSIEQVLAIMPLLVRARARIKSYGNASSIADELLFSILEEKAKCKR